MLESRSEDALALLVKLVKSTVMTVETYMRKRIFVAETAIWAKKIGGKCGLKMA